MSLLLIIFVLTNHNQDYHVLYFSHQSRVNSQSPYQHKFHHVSVNVERCSTLQPSHLTSFMSVPDLVNISVPNPPLCQTKLSLQLDLHGALVPIPTAVTKSLCTGLVPTKHGAVLIHAANV